MLRELIRIRVVSELLEAGGNLPKGFRANEMPLPDKVDDDLEPYLIADWEAEFHKFPHLMNYYDIMFSLMRVST